MTERGLLRRVAAILFHRRAGFSANGMGVWQVPDDAASRRSARGWPPSAASRTATSGPTYADWKYQIFTMAHGRSKEECDAILDAIAARVPRDRGPRDALLEHRVQEDPAALLHRRLPRLGARARGCLRARSGRRPTARGRRTVVSVSLRDTRSEELYARARQYLPGGVNSPVRAMRAIGRDPLFVERGAGAEITDVDGNTYVDYVCSWGPLILGHAHPRRDRGGRGRGAPGHDVRRADAGRGRPRRGGRAPRSGHRDAAHDELRHRGRDERRAPRARGDRPREAAEVRRRLPRPRRRPARARPGAASRRRRSRRARASRRPRRRAP